MSLDDRACEETAGEAIDAESWPVRQEIEMTSQLGVPAPRDGLDRERGEA
jgi:hypothetical protein